MTEGRKGGGAARRGTSGSDPSLFLTFFLALAFSFAAYNLLFVVIREHIAVVGSATTGSSSDHDVLRVPGGVARRPGSSAVTVNGDTYSRLRCRIMYYWYTQVRGMPGSAMDGFTRILDSSRPDNLMEEIPTVVIDPLPGRDRVST